MHNISKNLSSLEPELNCSLCPRLVQFRQQNQKNYKDWHNAPVHSFGPIDATLLIIGLAPGLKGANRTGRPFTGDYAGHLLYSTLLKYDYASGAYDERPDDGLKLKNCRITNAVRCVPPENKPTSEEIKICQSFLYQQILTLPRLKTVLALGKIAHDSFLDCLKIKKSQYPFGHAQKHVLPLKENKSLTLIDSYHCSKYNTSTKRLTEKMFHSVFDIIKSIF